MKKILLTIVFLFIGAVVYTSKLLIDRISPKLSQAVQQIEDLNDLAVHETTLIFDSAGNKIGELSGKRRYNIDIDNLDAMTIRAFLAAEDANFYNHSGISLSGIARAIWVNYRSSKTLQGASTISQQKAL